MTIHNDDPAAHNINTGQWNFSQSAGQEPARQEIRYGGLSEVAKRRLEELIAEIEIPPGDGDRTVMGKLRKPKRPDDPPAGTTLVRTFKGRELRLHVREDGYELDEVLHPSLTAAARAATGSAWNGRLFWGLTSRKKG